MGNHISTNDYFSEYVESFTIYVVEQKFAVNQGREYFQQFANKENFINSNGKMTNHLSKVLKWVQKKIPDIADIIKNVLLKTSISSVGIVDLIVSLNKLFNTVEHQAVGPEVINPIIVEEINISPKYISQLVSLYKESILQPAIIIILKDNDFDRAKNLLSNCPHNTNVKLIRNNGETELYKIINTGANNMDDFIDAFSRQCFSTCSKTNREVLLNSEWDNNNIVKSLSPYFFKTRTNLLFDEKPEAITDINYVLDKVSAERSEMGNDETLLNSLELMSKLNRIYCLDTGGTDINDAIALAKELDIELLKAHVYRFAHFIPNISRDKQKELLKEAGDIFKKNNVADHAMYCRNNFLVHSFYTDRVNTREFKDLQQQAICDVPGMVGMSIILNNVGVAYLYKKDFTEAITFFKKGLDYSKERVVQKIGLQSNIFITKACAYEIIDEKELNILLETVLANFSKNYLPFIAANYIMNILAIALEQHYSFGKSILLNNKASDIISSALSDNILGTGSLTQQIIKIQSRFPKIDFSRFPMPHQISQLSGVRAAFIMEKGYNPMIFNAWL